MAWMTTTLEVAASQTKIYQPAGYFSKLIFQADNAGAVVKPAMSRTLVGSETDQNNVSADVPKEIESFPFVHCIADGGGTRTFIIAERVKDPS